MQIAVCDDEEGVRELLAEKLQQLFPQAELASYPSGEALLAAAHPPDILLLDIQMPGMDGMEAARRLREKGWKTILIFVSAAKGYVFQSFDVGAFHYLVKPFTDERLAAILQKAAAQLREPSPSSQEPRCILIKSGANHVPIRLDQVVYAEVFNRKILVHQTDGEVEYYGRLSELERQVGEDFFRPHRAYLVHFKYVVRYNASTVWLTNGTALMSKQNYPAFVKGYLKYSRRMGWKSE